MRKNRSGYIKNLLIPCFMLSALAGIFTALLIFAFKIISNAFIKLSVNIYSAVREAPHYLPLLLLGALLLGLASALILKISNDCKGGGIPTAVTALRGLIPFRWFKSAFIMPVSALITFLCGVPLGNEGPCVQMGTAVGSGTVRMFGKKYRAWNRYIMTGGACAGFSAATGAPVTGILFAVEEAHRRFSPLLFMVASVSVVISQITIRLLGAAFGVSLEMFDITVSTVLPIRHMWIPIAVGIVCGICAIFFTQTYRKVRRLISERLVKIPFTVRVIFIFVLVATVGFFSADSIGSGHDLIEDLLNGKGIRYMLAAVLLVRAILLILSNNVGVTGGLFIPTLTFGAIIGAIFAEGLTYIGVMEAEYSAMIVVVGMTSFLASSSRTPITACVFAIEALCVPANILPVAIGVAVAYLVIEAFGIESFNDTVIESKVEASHRGRTPEIFDVHLTVMPKAFVIEKEIRDILWPPTCVVLSVEKNANATNSVGLSEGDILHVHFQSYDPQSTFKELQALVGFQASAAKVKVYMGNENEKVPEL